MDYDTLRPNRSLGNYFKKKGRLSYEQQVRRNLTHTRKRARHNGIPFEITIADIPINKVCPILGIPLSFEGPRGNTPTVDKVDSSRGYVPGNVRLISHRANRWKNDMTLEDAKLLILNWNKISA